MSILKSSNAPRTPFEKANTSSVKSSKRYQALFGQRRPTANRSNSISARWTIVACNLRTICMVVGRHSCTRTTFQKLQVLSITQFRQELRTRLCTACAGRTASFVWYHVRGEPLRDRQGRIIQWYGLSIDIDEAKKAEDRLRRSEAYLAAAQRLSHTGSAVYNETEILHWSEEASRIFGFDPLQGIPSREAVWQRIHPDDVDRVNENIERGVREKRSFANEFRTILPDGTVKYVEATNDPVFSASGELLEIVATGMDVTERKRVDDALRESERSARSAIDGIAGLVSVLAPNGELETANRQ